MNKIFNDAKDKNVATVIVYLNESNALFYDKSFTNSVSNEEAKDLFFKGVVAVKDGVYRKPVSCTEEGVIDFGIETV